MATLEDKILGEKLEYYCSSSSEEEADDSGNSDTEIENKECATKLSTCTSSYDEWDGTSSNTGPKGVIRDWQRCKQLASEKRIAQEQKHLVMMKKFSLTCRSTLDDEKQKLEETDSDLLELLDDDFLLEYQKQRMQEMLAKAIKLQFGDVINLSNGDEFLNAIDNEDKSVTIVVHIYEKNIVGCEAMNECLLTLAQEYPHVKFCRILGSSAGVSHVFKRKGIPALLVYKNGQVIGNFVHITDTLGIDFHASDVENFLLEQELIVKKNCIPKIIRDATENGDSD